MTLFLESSALVKRYLEEPDSAAIRALRAPIVISVLTRVEVQSAIWRKARERALAPRAAKLLSAVAELEIAGGPGRPPIFGLCEARNGVLSLAARLPARHGLSTGDAVQLATAVIARELDPRVGAFVCFDATLARAARAEGFTVPEPG